MIPDNRLTAANVYTLVEAKCSDAEILAYAAMTATCAQWLAIKKARRWLNCVRSDEIDRARVAGSGGESRSTL